MMYFIYACTNSRRYLLIANSDLPMTVGSELGEGRVLDLLLKYILRMILAFFVDLKLVKYLIKNIFIKK